MRDFILVAILLESLGYISIIKIFLLYLITSKLQKLCLVELHWDVYSIQEKGMELSQRASNP